MEDKTEKEKQGTHSVITSMFISAGNSNPNSYRGGNAKVAATSRPGPPAEPLPTQSQV